MPTKTKIKAKIKSAASKWWKSRTTNTPKNTLSAVAQSPGPKPATADATRIAGT